MGANKKKKGITTCGKGGVFEQTEARKKADFVQSGQPERR